MRFVRSFLFLSVFLLFWVTTAPFIDLRNPDVLLAQESGSTANQVAIFFLLPLSLWVLWANWDVARKLVSPAMVCVLLWQFVTVITSSHPDLSIRRYILAVLLICLTGAWILAPEGTAQFRRLLRLGALFVLGLAYLGIAIWPEVSIHNTSEVLELINAGSWRGHFAHKNIAGPALAVLMLYWLYLASTTESRTGKLVYWALALLSMIFLYNTNNKTSIGLIAAMFLLSELIRRTRSFALQIVLALLPVGVMALFTLGSVLFPPVAALTDQLVSDPTYTNRTAIWTYAIGRLQGHLWTGYGYEAFWSTAELLNTFSETWANTAGHAHNALLNVAMSSGLVGVVLTIWWVMINPLRDFNKSQQTANDPSLGLLYLRIWLFMMLYANLESAFFVGRGPVWFSLLGAMLGLRLHASSVLVATPEPAADAVAIRQT